MIRTTLVLAALARVADAGELTSAGPLAIRAPDGLVLGRDTTADVHLHAEPGVHLVTTAGTLSELAGDRATLTLPTEQFPQLAIIAAVTSDGTVRDWLAIPLAGQARVKVETERRATVVVRVGTAEFGPVQADARGVAQVDIVVPPGITHATTIATGSNGAIREEPLPLGVQPFVRLLAVCGELGDRVTVVAAAGNGAPATTRPRLAASTGTLAAATTAAPGIFVALHRGDAAAEIAVSFAGEESVAARCTLRVPPELPSAIRLAADRPRFVAGSGAITLAIALDYPGARLPLEIAEIALEADAGTLGAPQRDGHTWTAVWTLPDAFAGKARARATARAHLPDGSELRADIQLELAAAAAARIAVSAPARLRANGSAGGTVVARVVDRFDNAVAAPNLAATARGRVGGFAPRAGGATTASYVAPRAREPGDDVVEISDRASGVTGRARIELEPLPRQFAFSVRAGYLSNLGRVSTPIAAVSAESRLPVLDDRVVAGIEILGYSTAFAVQATDETVSGRVSVLPVLARVAYRRSLGAIDAWVGGGAGVAFASARLASASSGTETDGMARFAATGFVGGATRIGPCSIVVEGAYLQATLPDGPVAGRIGGIVATVGVALEL